MFLLLFIYLYLLSKKEADNVWLLKGHFCQQGKFLYQDNFSPHPKIWVHGESSFSMESLLLWSDRLPIRTVYTLPTDSISAPAVSHHRGTERVLGTQSIPVGRRNLLNFFIYFEKQYHASSHLCEISAIFHRKNH